VAKRQWLHILQVGGVPPIQLHWQPSSSISSGIVSPDQVGGVSTRAKHEAMADIALGGVPLAVKAIQSCLELYKLFTEAREIGNASQSLLWKFRIQQTRLQIWGEEWGLLASTSHQPRTESDDGDNILVIEALLRISNILNNYKQLGERYGLSLVSDDPKYSKITVKTSKCLCYHDNRG